MSKITFECTVHNLKYEYPDDWSDQNLAPPCCAVCANEEVKLMMERFDVVLDQRDKLAAAIQVKTSIKLEEVMR